MMKRVEWSNVRVSALSPKGRGRKFSFLVAEIDRLEIALAESSHLSGRNQPVSYHKSLACAGAPGNDGTFRTCDWTEV